MQLTMHAGFVYVNLPRFVSMFPLALNSLKPWEFAEKITPVQSAGLVRLRSNNQLCLLDLGVTFKSNIRGNISTKHIMGEQHLGKEIMGKQLWHTQRRQISRCFGDFSCTSEAIWMLLRTLARLQFIELCPKGTDLIIVSIFLGGVQCIFEIWLPTTYDMFFRFLFQMFKGFRLELDFVKSLRNPDCMVVTCWVVFIWADFAQSWESFDTRAPQKPWLKGMDAIELLRSTESPWLDASWKQNRQMGVSKQAPKLSWNVVESSQRSRSMGKICSISLDKVAKWWWSMFILDSQEPNFGSWRCFTIQFSNMSNMGGS